MQTNIQYYCVGFIWKGTKPENQLPRFLDDGIWENGFDDKYLERVNSIPTGSRIAAKTTYTMDEDDEKISILKIYATGTVRENLHNGQTLKIKWDKTFEPYIIKNKGAYRSTISRINSRETIKEIFRDDKNLIKENGIPFYSVEEFKKEYHVFPCFVFTKDKWDDFSYQTQYEIAYHSSSKESLSIGSAKFLDKDEDNGELPPTFYKAWSILLNMKVDFNDLF
jgi:hypothetical protein